MELKTRDSTRPNKPGPCMDQLDSPRIGTRQQMILENRLLRRDLRGKCRRAVRSKISECFPGMIFRPSYPIKIKGSDDDWREQRKPDGRRSSSTDSCKRTDSSRNSSIFQSLTA